MINRNGTRLKNIIKTYYKHPRKNMHSMIRNLKVRLSWNLAFLIGNFKIGKSRELIHLAVMSQMNLTDQHHSLSKM